MNAKILIISVLFYYTLMPAQGQFIVTQKSNGDFTAIEDPVNKMNSLNFSSLFSPLPPSLDSTLEKIDSSVKDIMNVTSILVRMQGSLTTTFGLNTQVTNTAIASQLNDQFRPYRPNLNSFFSAYGSIPLYYTTIFDMFAFVKGSTNAIFNLANVVKDTLSFSDNLLSYMLSKLNVLSSQDLNYFAIESAQVNSNETVQEFWNNFKEYLANNNRANVLNIIDNSNLTLYLTLISGIKINNIQSRTDLYDQLISFISNSTFTTPLYNVYVSDSSKLNVDFLYNLRFISKYLGCKYLAKVDFQNFISNMASSSQFDTELLENIFKCNVNFSFEYFNYYKSRRQEITYSERTIATNYYMRYKILTGKSISFTELNQLVQDIPKDIYETHLIISYITRGDSNTANYAVLSEFIAALSANNISFNSIDGNMKDVFLKHSNIVLKSKLNSVWSTTEWNLFKDIIPLLTFDEISSYLTPNNRYQSFLNYTKDFSTEFWSSKCDFTMRYYSYLLSIKSNNSDPSINYDSTKKLMVCKYDCDFSAWISDSTTDTEIRSLVLNFFPYLSSAAKQYCQGSRLANAFRALIQNLNNLTQADLQILINSGFSLSTLFSASELANLSPSVLRAFSSTIINMQFDKQSARVILNKLIDTSNPSSLTISSIGNLIVGLDVNSLNSLSTNDLRLNLGRILSSVDDMDSYFKELLIQKYFGISYSKTEVINILNTKRADLIQLITLDRVKNVGLKLSDLQSLNLPDGIVPSSIIMYLTDEYLRGKPVEQWTLSDLKSCNQQILTGLSTAQIRTLVTNLGVDAVKIIGNRNNQYQIPSETSQEIVNGLRDYLIKNYGPLPENYMKNLPDELIDILTDEAFSQFRAYEYQILLDKPVFSKLLERLSKMDVSKFNYFPISVSRSLAWFAIQYLKKESSVLTVNDLKTIGPGLVKFIPFYKIKEMPIETIASVLEYFQGIENLLSTSEMTEFQAILEKIYGTVYQSNMEVAKPKFGSLILKIVTKIPQVQKIVTIAKAAVSVANCGLCLLRRSACSSHCNNLPKPFNLLYKGFQAVKKVVTVVKKVVKFFRRRFGRRRRDTDSEALTCQKIREYQSLITELDYDLVESMDETEFFNCLTEFGKYSDYDADLLKTIKLKLLKNLSNRNVSQINDATINEMDNIALAFTANEIDQWQITKMDTIASLGKLDLNKTQATVLAGKTKSLLSNNQFRDIDLKSMGNIICGLDSSDFSSMDTNTFKSSIATFSNLNSGCNENDYTNLMELSKRAYSDSLWSRSQLNEIGYLAAGLNVDDLKTKLTPSLLSSIDKFAFSLMNKDVLKEIASSNGTLTSLNREQILQIQSNNNFKLLENNLQDKINYQLDGEYSRVASIIPTGSTTTDSFTTTVKSILPGGNFLISKGSTIYCLKLEFIISSLILGILFSF